MPRGSYDPVRSVTDPLTTMHIKLPKSVVAAVNRAAAKRVRPAVFIYREILEEWATKWRQGNDDETAGDEAYDLYENAPRRAKKKRRA